MSNSSLLSVLRMKTLQDRRVGFQVKTMVKTMVKTWGTMEGKNEMRVEARTKTGKSHEWTQNLDFKPHFRACGSEMFGTPTFALSAS